jgi:hypothetical protein
MGLRHHARRATIALIASFTASGAATAQSQPGSIRGVVIDTAGKPVQGATVGVNGRSARKLTNARGEFVLDSVPAGRQVVRVSMIAAYPQIDTVVVEAASVLDRRYTLRRMPPPPLETLPPRYARGARPDTAPREAEAIDLAARVARLPQLRARPPMPPRRELRLWSGGGIAIPMNLIRLTIDGDRVHGEVIQWLIQTVPDRDVDPKWRTFMDSVPNWLRRDFGCGRVATDTLHFPGAQKGYENELVAVCTSRYRREPDWRGLLRELEAHQVWTLPDASELPSLANIVSLDGGGVTVEAWDGARYHTYTFGNVGLIPAPEARDAGAIQRILVAFLTRIHGDLR